MEEMTRESRVSLKTLKMVSQNECRCGYMWSGRYEKRNNLGSSLFGHRALFGGTYSSTILQNISLSSLSPSL